MEWAVEVKGVSKRFIIKHNRAHDIKTKTIGLVDPRHRERQEEFWALRDVTLSVQKGECLGLIGPNGSGKSTLLRLLSRILPPTHGEVVVHGRIAPMLEIGVGFHPDLTGHENVYLNTSMFRLSRRETDAIYDQIVEFSELEQFMDMPVKNYSSGMYARLAFSAAIHLQPDVLLIDEVLAVGDERFQLKCLQRIEQFRQQGKTIVLVSHGMASVEQMCDRACFLFNGRLEAEGRPSEVVASYRAALATLARSARPLAAPSASVVEEAPAVLSNSAAFVKQRVPQKMVALSENSVALTFLNTGLTTWTPTAHYALGISDNSAAWGVVRARLAGPVAPGEETTFEFTVTAPSVAGSHALTWRMVQDTVEWFGPASPPVLVRVVAR